MATSAPLAPERGPSGASTHTSPEARKKWYETTVAKVGAGLTAVSLAAIVGSAIGSRGHDAPAPQEPGAAAPAVPGEGQQGLNTTEQEQIEFDWGRFIKEPTNLREGAFDDEIDPDAREQQQKQLVNELLVPKITRYLNGMTEYIALGGNPEDAPRELINSITTDPDNPIVDTLNGIATQLVDGTPEGSNLTWIWVGQEPNDNQPLGDQTPTSSFFGTDIIWSWVTAEGEYIPEGQGAEAAERKRFKEQYPSSVQPIQIGGELKFTQASNQSTAHLAR